MKMKRNMRTSLRACRLRGVWGWSRRRLAEEGGFSLVELLVVSTFLFLLTAMILNFMEEGTAVTRGGSAGAEVNQEFRETVEMMTRQIRLAYYFTPAGTNTSQVDFYGYVEGDNTKWHVQFYVNPDTQELVRAAAPLGGNLTPEVVARGVYGLTFSYYDADGAATADTTKIARVDFYLLMRRDYTGTVGKSTTEGVMTEELTGRYVEVGGNGSAYIRNALATAP
jgi:Tfp pilus assembly protein FimT